MSLLLALMLSLLPHQCDEEPLIVHEYKLKPNGAINLVEDTLIRDKLLPRGKYTIQHRIDGDQHVVIIAQAPNANAVPRPAIVVSATLVPVRAKLSKFVVYADPPAEG